MRFKAERTGIPPDLETAISTHAAALVGGDDRLAASFVDPEVAAAISAALERTIGMRPLRDFEVIARARLGFQYVVKLRLTSATGMTVTLQERWHREKGGAWRLIEVEDTGLRSPWKKPERNPVEKGAH
jgi:hypothetical protein